ncbi:MULTISPECIES: hypothetical protein [unclassified Mesorhizobium]|uniref:hypothetical protein n=1 Tax=unclassified Mesorhizobium TaxID=325217 RepID=UPI00112C014D|nr:MULTISPECIES: hypothetical protein [unclassified Mesorhizobium]TPI21020.1 hypothetical protein FJW10_09760 [Mesorhizobium sp. B4-1-1]TPL54354.1 hypothetical protein FJ957_03035 [Mesorhizobium sp. B2-4-6]
MPTEYENGARKPVTKDRPDPNDAFSQEAAANKKPSGGMGLTRPVEEVQDRKHQRDGQNQRQPTPSPSTEKTSGAGPAVSEHSKDTKAPKTGRQPGAYVKE